MRSSTAPSRRPWRLIPACAGWRSPISGTTPIGPNAAASIHLRFTAGGLFGDNTGGECWELLVAMANECGKDLYVALPMQAEDAYIEKFGRLIRYGSDGARALTTMKWKTPSGRP